MTHTHSEEERGINIDLQLLKLCKQFILHEAKGCINKQASAKDSVNTSLCVLYFQHLLRIEVWVLKMDKLCNIYAFGGLQSHESATQAAAAGGRLTAAVYYHDYAAILWLKKITAKTLDSSAALWLHQEQLLTTCEIYLKHSHSNMFCFVFLHLMFKLLWKSLHTFI